GCPFPIFMMLVLNVVIARDFCFNVNPLSAIKQLKIRTARKRSPQPLETKHLVMRDYVLLNPVFKNLIILNTFLNRPRRFLRSVLIVNYSGDHIVDTEPARRWRNVLCSTCGAQSGGLPTGADSCFFSIKYLSASTRYKDAHNCSQ